MNIDWNERIGPTLSSDVFAGFSKMDHLSIADCDLKHIENGTFRAMHNLSTLDLSGNVISHLQPGALEGPGDRLLKLKLARNRLETIADGTFARFSKLTHCYLHNNMLRSVPDFTGLTSTIMDMRLYKNRITDISQLGKAGSKLEIYTL
ncbi:tsukushin-like [Orbicella faveolata]|uniref:tsukushin-like n=1 Tax=Orbicella faveolata TaxID=48498 RepID=UPI0009E31369|nr:tsukushin-like [Orbicella faveolata]